MTGKVDICNLALAEIGKITIESIDEDSPAGRACKRYWDQVRRSILADYDWAFAKKTMALTESAEDTNPNWPYCYVCPSDCLMPRKVYQAGTGYDSPRREFEVIQASDGNSLIIVSNISSAILDYTANVVLAEMFDPAFVEAMIYRLAWKITVPLGGDRNTKSDMLQLYNLSLDAAKTHNRMKRYDEPSNVKNSPYYNCRE